jgi:hypothetical protein
MRTRQLMEQALDSGKLSVVLSNGRIWKTRRNGKTRLWKRNANRFWIPIKAGLKLTGAIHEGNLHHPMWVIEE